MATKRDYYEILGVDKKASIDDIKLSYRKLAMQYHPDKNKALDAEDKFKEISEAYAVLSDQGKRQQYDQFGHAGIDQRYSREDIFRGVNFEDIFRDIGVIFHGFGGTGGDIFNIIFGGGMGSGDSGMGSGGSGGSDIGGNRGMGGRNGWKSESRRYDAPIRGSDILYKLDINLEDVANGKTVELEVPRTEICSVCNGSGTKPGTYQKMCSICKGSGQISSMKNTPFGRFMTTSICGTCRGTGNVIDSPCVSCHGGGTVKKFRKIEVKITPGVDIGSRLRIAGEGDVGKQGGPNGDLYIEINVRPHNIFMRNGNDLVMETIINIVQAALGVEIMVPTIDGKVKMKIPPGTQNGHVFRLKGKGVQSIHTSWKGDQLVRIRVAIPTKLTDKQKNLLREFEKEI
jgi:molecular chaperone DnaJ